MLDKGRATLAGKNGEYIYNSPTDQRLVQFLGFDPDALLKELATGKSDGGGGTGGSRLYKTQMPIKETGLFCIPITHIYCVTFYDAALSFSWLAQPGWTSQEHGIMF